MSKLKELKQEDYRMVIVKDLRMKNMNGKNRRYALFKCPVCLCDFESRTDSARNNNQSRCGKCISVKHGLSVKFKREYTVWNSEQQRCKNPKVKSYIYYGARGIKVSPIFDDFPTWLKYVSSLPNSWISGYELDRVHNDYDYEPMNLRWATKSEQMINRRPFKRRTKSKCVYFNKKSQKWTANIRHDFKTIYLGIHETRDEALLAREQAEQYYGYHESD